MELKAIDISKLTKTSRANISKLTKGGGLIKNEHGKYDSQNLINKDYFISHEITENKINDYILLKSDKKDKKNIKIKDKSLPIPIKKEKKQNNINMVNIEKIDISEDNFENITGLPAKLMSWSIKKIVMKYGSTMMLDKLAGILQKLTAANERDQKAQERRLELIEKDFCVSKLFLYIENLSKLLFDFPESCIDEMIALIKSNKDNIRNELVNNMRKELGILIEQTKNSIDRELKTLLNKYEKEKIENAE